MHEQTRNDLSLIVAKTKGGVIGKDNDLPWKIKSDMRRFVAITMEEENLVMGRKTCESILSRSGKLLSGRHHIVVSRSCSFPKMDSLEVVRSVEEAMLAIAARGGRACVIGGQQIYALFLAWVNTAYITEIYADIEGDVFFPEMNRHSWTCRHHSPVRKWHPSDEFETSFQILHRVPKLAQD